MFANDTCFWDQQCVAPSSNNYNYPTEASTASRAVTHNTYDIMASTVLAGGNSCDMMCSTPHKPTWLWWRAGAEDCSSLWLHLHTLRAKHNCQSNSSNPADFRQQEPTLLLQMPLQVSYPLLLQFNQLLLCQLKQLCRAAQGCRLAARLCDTAPQQLQPHIMGGPCLQPAQDKQRGQHRGEWLAASWHAT